ncbi:MAG: ribosomal protein [Pseudonocardiales bacterium]|nr:ribosomal protein [Jatrophihabitantaceae bacterium]MCW2602818.1 ribosomal protein [Pseudonocardiales bacterium]
MAEVRLNAEIRTEFGKGGARRTRRAGQIPAVLYGHGAEPKHIALPAREFANAIKRGGSNVLLTLSIDGQDELALPKAIQRHPIKPEIEHVDLISVRLGEKITVDVQLIIVGDVVSGGLVAQEATSLSVEAEATHLPSSFDISIDGVAVGTQITAADVILPAGTVLAGDPEQILIIIQEAPTAEALEAEGGGDSIASQAAENAPPVAD